MVVEVMGRDCGWIALEAGIAGGAHVILIPEIPFTIGHICRYIAEREKTGKYFTIVVVAEGVKLPPELKENRRASSSRQPDRQCHRPLAPTRKCGSACSGTFSAAARRRPLTAFWQRASAWPPSI